MMTLFEQQGGTYQNQGELLNLKITYTYSLLIHCLQIPRRNQIIQKRSFAKSIFEQLGGTYHEENGYLIPDLRLPAEEEQPIGTWEQRHLDYLKQHHKVAYTNLLTSGSLNAYLADIDRQAQEHFERLIEGMKQA